MSEDRENQGVARLVGAVKLGLPAINPGSEVTPESAEFRLCLVPVVEASESSPGRALRAPRSPAPALSCQPREGRKDLMFSFSVPSSLFLFLLNLFSLKFLHFGNETLYGLLS